MYSKEWKSQMRKGAIDVFIMTLLLQRRELYGLELIAALEDKCGLKIPYGTLYPLMSRLQREGCIVCRWSTENPGHPRKYFRITPHGRKTAALMDAELSEFMQQYARLRDGKE